MITTDIMSLTKWKKTTVLEIPVPCFDLAKDVMLMDLDCIALAFVPLSPFKFSLLKSNYDGILSMGLC